MASFALPAVMCLRTFFTTSFISDLRRTLNTRFFNDARWAFCAPFVIGIRGGNYTVRLCKKQEGVSRELMRNCLRFLDTWQNADSDHLGVGSFFITNDYVGSVRKWCNNF